MTITIVGLGLIGGSFAKTLKVKTNHTVWGIDINKTVLDFALSGGDIDKIVTAADLKKSDLTLICLYPEQTIEFVMQNINNFAPDSIVADTCGVKDIVVKKLTKPLEDKKVTFLGTHPMAGKEYSGYGYSTCELFKGASWILTPESKTPVTATRTLKLLGEQLGFEMVVTDSVRHDELIAYTSHLAHIVSNAYVKNPYAKEHKGFSAGSFMDLTRIARLNENMWTDIMIANRNNLFFELDAIIGHLTEYKSALRQKDSEKLRKLLKEGSDIKKEID